MGHLGYLHDKARRQALVRFEAKRAGTCNACQRVIEEGDVLRWDEFGKPVHADCGAPR